MDDDAVLADRYRYQLTMLGIPVLIGLSRLLRAHIAYEIDTAIITAALIWISYCLNDLIRLNSIVRHVQTTKCTMIGFRCSIPLSIECVWNSSMDRAISTLSCSYCIWNRWCQNHSRIMPNFQLFVWFDTAESNRLPCARARCTMMLFSMIHSDIW